MRCDLLQRGTDREKCRTLRQAAQKSRKIRRIRMAFCVTARQAERKIDADGHRCAADIGTQTIGQTSQIAHSLRG